MVIHNHQPCDNFGWVFEDAYNKSYKPFIDVLEKYPSVNIAMHYSGGLLEWFLEHKPEFIKRIKALVKKGNIALLGGGFYEPIFPIIPDKDKKGQIRLLNEFLNKHFEYDTKGLWVTERVWENNLADIFLKEGFEYTLIDENHLKHAGVPEKDIRGYFQTENGFKVFPANKKLRYMIPFAKVNDVAAYFNRISQEIKESKTLNGSDGDNRSISIFADDGEKFGFWPHTYDWVYKRGWLERFFEYLSNPKSPIETVSFKNVLESFKSSGRVSIPPSSYSEMMEWSNGDFNNFFKFYPEANIMRNRMLSMSADIDRESMLHASSLSKRDLVEKARRELYKAQAGCAYWHGVFGGFYMNHLRAGVYKHLINAKNILSELRTGDRMRYDVQDFDNDACNEIIIGNEFLDLYVKPDESGSIFSFDDKRKSYNIMNIITRRHEPYHSKLFKTQGNTVKDMKASLEKGLYLNIHDILGIKGKGLKRFLIYDEQKKNSVMEYFSSNNKYFNGNRNDLVRLYKAPYGIKKIINKDYVALNLKKNEDIILKSGKFCINITKGLLLSNTPQFTVSYVLKNLSGKKLKTVFGTEFNWSFMNKYYMKKRKFSSIRSFVLKDEWSGIQMQYDFNSEVKLWTEPIYTLNETEAGLDKTYQYLNMMVERPLSLDQDQSLVFKVVVSIN